MPAISNRINVNGKSYTIVGVIGRGGRDGYLLQNNKTNKFEYFPAYYPNVQNDPNSVFGISLFNKVPASLKRKKAPKKNTLMNRLRRLAVE
jgi:hypothetical protein